MLILFYNTHFMKIKFLFSIALILFCQLAKAQSKYFVYLKDKANSSYKISEPEKFLSSRSIDRRKTQGIAIIERDIPVSLSYISEINKTGAKAIYSSKWMNAVLVSANTTQLASIKNFSFVKAIEGNADISGAKINGTYKVYNTFSKFGSTEDYEYGTSQNQIEQIEANLMHKAGFTGKGILIGVLDSGFSNADKLDVFKHLFDKKRILHTYDFVNNETNVYNDDSHGTSVLSCIVGNTSQKIIGTAPDAELVLFTTEDVRSETRLEEINWLIAAEKADSLGVDVINSSLGYSTFDNPAQNYTYADMTGDKTICAKAADWAVATGILVVVSAGNEGNGVWKYVGTPADADSVISVGAVDAVKNLASFSSRGPNAKNNIKPEVVAKGVATTVANSSNSISNSNGTSFSSPIMAGFVASLKQAYPRVSAMKIRELLLKSSSQYNTPDNLKGYGIPSFSKFKELADKYLNSLILGTENFGNSISIYPNPKPDKTELKIELDGFEIGKGTILSITAGNGRIYGNITYENLNNALESIGSGTFLISFTKNAKQITSRIVIP